MTQSSAKANPTWKQLLAPLASLKLTVVLLVLSMILIYAGTWAQLDANIWQVQKQYFHSFVAWLDPAMFFPRDADGARRSLTFTVGGQERALMLLMPGGYTIGLALLINLLSAHILRFKGTWRDLILVPLLALMIVPLVVWQYNGADWLANFVGRAGIDLARIPFPFFVWVVLLSIVVGLPFYVALFMLHGRRGGIIMIHLGLLMLLVGEGITSGTQVERQMQIDEGSYANFAQDIRVAELAVVDESPSDHNDHVVVPASMLKPGTTVRDTRLPFDVKVEQYFTNSDIGDDRSQAKATSGSGVGVPVVGARPVRGTDQQNTDFPSAYVTLSKDRRPLGTYLVTVMELAPRFKPIHRPQPVEVDGKTYTLQLRFKREYCPYQIHLIDFIHDRYTGTDTPKDFASIVRLVDPQQHEDREVRIWMNHPLRYRGETFYQSSFKPGDKTTILLVVKNPALVLPYAACAITPVGMLAHFVIVLREFLRKRAVAATARAGPAAAAPAAAPVGMAGVIGPAGVVLAGLLAVVVAAIPRSKPDGNMDLDAFSKLPVSFNGRVVPFDSVARNGLKVMCGKESLYHEGKPVPPRRFLLDTFAEPEKSNQYKVIRIDHPDVKSLLGLKDDQKYFSLADILPSGAKFDEQFEKVRNLPPSERNMFHNAIADLGRRLQLFMTLRRFETLHAAAPTAAGQEWRTLADAMQEAGGDAAKLNPSATAFVGLVHAYHEKDADAFNRAVADYRAAVAPVAPDAIAKASIETWYNAFAPFFLCCILYVVVFILAACSWIGWTKPFARAAFGLLVVAVIVHTLAIVTRVYLSGRAPVTNLETTAIFIGWIVVLLGMVLERIYRSGVGSVLAGVIGFLSLTIYLNLAKDDTMKVLQAVLDTNFWLWTHVPAINIGYAATFLAGAIGIVYVIMGLFSRGLDRDLSKDLTRMIYGITCFAILFSFVGTVLGGIWADQSWGRFWGWDPKENGAVMIVLANALLLHARWGGLVRERGIACLAIFGNIITAWSYFGTNLLGVGLHSYGFMDSTVFWLLLFVGSQIALIAVANVPLRLWRSYPRLLSAPITRGPGRTSTVPAT